MADAEDQFTKLDKQYANDNPEGFDKVSGQAGKAWDEIVKTGAELADYTGADDAVDAVKKGASDAYNYATKGELEKDVNKATDYVTKGGINKDANKFKKYMQSPQAGKDAKAKGKEHKAYVDKKAGEVGDYFTGGEFGKDVDDASDWISNQWDSLFGDNKKQKTVDTPSDDKPNKGDDWNLPKGQSSA
jgi:general stress protein YciG